MDCITGSVDLGGLVCIAASVDGGKRSAKDQLCFDQRHAAHFVVLAHPSRVISKASLERRACLPVSHLYKAT